MLFGQASLPLDHVQENIGLRNISVSILLLSASCWSYITLTLPYANFIFKQDPFHPSVPLSPFSSSPYLPSFWVSSEHLLAHQASIDPSGTKVKSSKKSHVDLSGGSEQAKSKVRFCQKSKRIRLKTHSRDTFYFSVKTQLSLWAVPLRRQWHWVRKSPRAEMHLNLL